MVVEFAPKASAKIAMSNFVAWEGSTLGLTDVVDIVPFAILGVVHTLLRQGDFGTVNSCEGRWDHHNHQGKGAKHAHAQI